MMLFTKEMLLSLLPEINEHGPLDPLVDWQKALLIELVAARAIPPCGALMFLNQCSHDDAHKILDEMDMLLGLEEKRPECEKETETVH